MEKSEDKNQEVNIGVEAEGETVEEKLQGEIDTNENEVENKEENTKEEANEDNLENNKDAEEAGEEDNDHLKNFAEAERLKTEANTKYRAKKYEEAIELYQQALTETPSFEADFKKKLYSNISIAFKVQQDWKNTVNYCSLALELDDGFEKALGNRANAYYKLDDYEKALEDYKKLREMKSEFCNEARIEICEKEVEKEFDQKKEQVMGQLKDLGNNLLGRFGFSLDNFKLNPQEGGGYNISFQQ